MARYGPLQDWRSFVRRRDDEAMGRDDKLSAMQEAVCAAGVLFLKVPSVSVNKKRKRKKSVFPFSTSELAPFFLLFGVPFRTPGSCNIVTDAVSMRCVS